MYSIGNDDFRRIKKMDLIQHTKEIYDDFFKSAHRDGTLSAKTKKLIHLALVLAMRCEP
jgi:alkylhydroperoxidase/carboxymuconolactone decarboxylase family protein YurZ